MTRLSSELILRDGSIIELTIISSVYTGYLDVDDGAKHMFFSFFESRRDPDNGRYDKSRRDNDPNHALDDVMMWINGGTFSEARDCLC